MWKEKTSTLRLGRPSVVSDTTQLFFFFFFLKQEVGRSLMKESCLRFLSVKPLSLITLLRVKGWGTGGGRKSNTLLTQ